MDSDLLLPLFWTFIFGALIAFFLRKISKKLPTKKKWVRPEKDLEKPSEENKKEK